MPVHKLCGAVPVLTSVVFFISFIFSLWYLTLLRPRSLVLLTRGNIYILATS